MAKYQPTKQERNIDYDKLQKVWNGTEKNTVTKESMPYIADEVMSYEQQSDLQNRILKEMPSALDAVYNLEIILSYILEKQGEQKDYIERLLEQQDDIAEEEKQTFTLEDICTTVAGFKTLIYSYIGIMAAISVLGITWKHKDPQTTHTHTHTNTHPTCKRAKKAKHV